MGYRNLRDCVADLERTGQLVRIEHEIDWPVAQPANRGENAQIFSGTF